MNMAIMLNNYMYYFELFSKIAALDDVLDTLPAAVEVKDFVKSSPIKLRSKLFNAVKENPAITLEELKKIISSIEEKEYFIEVRNFIRSQHVRIQERLFKALNDNPRITLEEIKNLVPSEIGVDNSDDLFAVEGLQPQLAAFLLKELGKARGKNQKKYYEILRNLNNIRKWHDVNHPTDISSYTIDRILDMANQYHQLATSDAIATTKSIPYLDNLLIGINEPLKSWIYKKLPEFMSSKGISLSTLDYEGERYRGEFIQLQDWYNNEHPMNLPELGFEEAGNLMVRWHGIQAEKYKGIEYLPLNRSLIVKGPNNWEDSSNNGYFIIELDNENDLRAEGAKMKHCVGTYFPKVKSGNCRIFSLRDSSNNPHATIETDSTASVFRQVYGAKNTNLEGKYEEMAKEWIDSRKHIFIDKVAPKLIANITTISRYYLEDLKSNNELLSEKYNKIILDEERSRGERVKLAEAKDTNPEQLMILAKDIDNIVRLTVAKHPNLPVKELLILVKDSDADVRYTAARHPNMPVEELQILAQDSDAEVRYAAAKHPNLPVKELLILVKDSDSAVRLAAAKHPNIPVEELQILAKDSSAGVRLAAAKHPNLPVKELLILVKDSDAEVRFAAARHPNMPVEELRILAKDSDAEVRLAAAKHPNIPVEELLILAKDSSAGVRLAAAKHPNMPAEGLLILAEDSDKESGSNIRCTAAIHPNMPAEGLLILAKDSSAGVRLAAAKHPNMPAQGLFILAKDSYAEVRLAAARHPNMPAEGLLILAKDSSAGVRLAAAKHPNMPAEGLFILAEDLDDRVRLAATRHPKFS